MVGLLGAEVGLHEGALLENFDGVKLGAVGLVVDFIGGEDGTGTGIFDGLFVNGSFKTIPVTMETAP